MNQLWKIIRIIGIVIIIIAAITAAGIYLIGNIFNEQNAGIIGGADKPTMVFLGTEFRFIIAVIIAEFAVGIGAVIASVIMKRKNNKDK